MRAFFGLTWCAGSCSILEESGEVLEKGAASLIVLRFRSAVVGES